MSKTVPSFALAVLAVTLIVLSVDLTVVLTVLIASSIVVAVVPPILEAVTLPALSTVALPPMIPAISPAVLRNWLPLIASLEADVTSPLATLVIFLSLAFKPASEI